MAIVPWNPFRDAEIMSRDLGGLFDLPNRLLGSSPRVDVYQTDKEVVVKAEIPGVSKEDLNLLVDENTVKLSGQTRKEDRFSDENAYRTERYYGSFSRTIPLPAEVKSDEAKAEYKDGILTVTMPKMEPSKTKGRRIDIQ